MFLNLFKQRKNQPKTIQVFLICLCRMSSENQRPIPVFLEHFPFTAQLVVDNIGKEGPSMLAREWNWLEQKNSEKIQFSYSCCYVLFTCYLASSIIGSLNTNITSFLDGAKNPRQILGKSLKDNLLKHPILISSTHSLAKTFSPMLPPVTGRPISLACTKTLRVVLNYCITALLLFFYLSPILFKIKIPAFQDLVRAGK